MLLPTFHQPAHQPAHQPSLANDPNQQLIDSGDPLLRNRSELLNSLHPCVPRPYWTFAFPINPFPDSHAGPDGSETATTSGYAPAGSEETAGQPSALEAATACVLPAPPQVRNETFRMHD
ncbi:hypothetical protein PG996_006489 [Apiospora saccharicola]|uniref:Uncharacterized protein n=1 Tax=Apiospora saccharicola TaxID=335842 RepID=A0ABR1VPH6_9PEZI